MTKSKLKKKILASPTFLSHDLRQYFSEPLLSLSFLTYKVGMIISVQLARREDEGSVCSY